ncbi:MAG: hypothetical protein DCC59_14585 [Chloroflexi bacterium]|nr:UbiA family prenyltransferase [Anaerolineales bacterium]RIK49127.1 MAG: hypothetical protein DCC59_14585 [Chloroflexota bacterium]
MLKLLRPLNLLLAGLTYLLGASIPPYLGESVQPAPFALGLAFALLNQAGMSLLSEVFRPHNEPLVAGETLKQKETLRNNMLHLSIGMLGTAATIAFIFHLNFTLTLPSFIFLLSSFILALTYSIPPFRLVNRGFGELILALHIAYVVPSIGFFFQSGENPRLLTLLLLPLTMLASAYFLVLDFTAYPEDEKYDRGSMLRRLGWERAIPLHHSLLAFAYLLFLSAPLVGYSLALVAPAFLTLPFALFQIVQLRAVANGNPPNWKLLTATALAVFCLTTYFLALTFWLR